MNTHRTHTLLALSMRLFAKAHQNPNAYSKIPMRCQFGWLYAVYDVFGLAHSTHTIFDHHHLFYKHAKHQTSANDDNSYKIVHLKPFTFLVLMHTHFLSLGYYGHVLQPNVSLFVWHSLYNCQILFHYRYSTFCQSFFFWSCLLHILLSAFHQRHEMNMHAINSFPSIVFFQQIAASSFSSSSYFLSLEIHQAEPQSKQIICKK